MTWDWIDFGAGIALGVALSWLVRAYIAEWREIEEAAKWE